MLEILVKLEQFVSHSPNIGMLERQCCPLPSITTLPYGSSQVNSLSVGQGTEQGQEQMVVAVEAAQELKSRRNASHQSRDHWRRRLVVVPVQFVVGGIFQHL